MAIAAKPANDVALPADGVAYLLTAIGAAAQCESIMAKSQYTYIGLRPMLISEAILVDETTIV